MTPEIDFMECKECQGKEGNSQLPYSVLLCDSCRQNRLAIEHWKRSASIEYAVRMHWQEKAMYWKHWFYGGTFFLAVAYLAISYFSRSS
jgi:hypothetical protein